MSIFKSLFSRKKKNTSTTTSDYSDVVIAEDCLNIIPSTSLTPLERCVAEQTSFRNLGTRLEVMKFVRGATDSKQKPQPQHKLSSSSRRESSVTINFNRERAPAEPFVLVEKLIRSSVTEPLYPILDPLMDQPTALKTAKHLSRVEEIKSIHDISREIVCCISKKILDADSSKKSFEIPEEDVQRDILAINVLLRGLSSFDYDFDEELRQREKLANVVNYEKLDSFAAVEKCHKKVSELRFHNWDKVNQGTAFQCYRKRLRCYRGRKDDKIYCE